MASPSPTKERREDRAIDAFKAKVILLGDQGVGKTSLVRRYVRNEFDDVYRITLGANVYKWSAPIDVAGRSIRVVMTLWDTMGEAARIDPFKDIYLRGVDGALVVCDVTDEFTVPSLGAWIDAAAGARGDVPVQILMNKVDKTARPEVREAALRAGLARAAPCYLTSAKRGDNVVAAFEDLARRIVERTLVPADGPLDDEDFALALACHSARTVEEAARLRGIAIPVAAARFDRLLRRGYVRLASLGLDVEGRPRLAYAATERTFLAPLRAAGR